jgi:hypothetical protein
MLEIRFTRKICSGNQSPHVSSDSGYRKTLNFFVLFCMTYNFENNDYGDDNDENDNT